MKWYWWLLIAVAIIVIIGLVIRSSKSKTVQVADTTNANGFDPFTLTTITTRK